MTARSSATNEARSEVLGQSRTAALVMLEDGSETLDFSSGGFGYGVQPVLDAVASQLSVLPLSTRSFLSRPLADLCSELARFAGGDLEVSYLCNSDAEAVDAAIKLARGFNRGRPEVVAVVSTSVSNDLGDVFLHYPKWRSLQRLPLKLTLVSNGDIAAAQQAITADTSIVLIEPVATALGVEAMTLEFVLAVRDACSRTGAVLISDETAIGLGRVGLQPGTAYGVRPDIVVLGGALGGGVLPVAAYVAQRRLNDAVYGRRSPVLHGTTTGGSPAACAAALAALGMIRELRVLERAQSAEPLIRSALTTAFSKFGAAAEVTVAGLAGAVAVPRAEARHVVEGAKRRGLLVAAVDDSAGRTWIQVRPPLLVEDHELRVGLSRLAAAAGAVLDLPSGGLTTPATWPTPQTSARTGTDESSVLTAYRRHYNPALAKMFGAARIPVESWSQGSYVYTEDGRRFLDFSAGYGVFGIGHGQASVRFAALQQLASQTQSPGDLPHIAVSGLVARLRGLLPGDLDHVLLAGSGSEAVEIALRVVSEAAPTRRKLVAAHDSYHGKSMGALALMGQRPMSSPFAPLWPDVEFVRFGDIDDLAIVLAHGDVAAVALEPVLGGGHLRTPPAGYLRQVAALCKEAGTLLIIDEVQTGFGRTGSMFAIEHEGIVPDLIVLSKGMTGGHTPMAAVVVRDEVVSSMPAGAWRRATHPASPITGSLVACAVASAAIDVTIELGLPERSAEQGEHLMSGLRRLHGLHPGLVREVRGRGLMAGIEVRNGMVEYALWLGLLRRGVLAGYSTNMHAPHPVLRTFPSLTVTVDEVDRFLDILDASLTAVARKPMGLYDAANVVLPLQQLIPNGVLRTAARVLQA